MLRVCLMLRASSNYCANVTWQRRAREEQHHDEASVGSKRLFEKPKVSLLWTWKKSRKWYNALADPRGRQGRTLPFSVQFGYFHGVFRKKIYQSNRLASRKLHEIEKFLVGAHLKFGAPWIRYCGEWWAVSVALICKQRYRPFTVVDL